MATSIEMLNSRPATIPPVEHFVVPNPRREIDVSNNGVDIASTKNSEARVPPNTYVRPIAGPHQAEGGQLSNTGQQSDKGRLIVQDQRVAPKVGSKGAIIDVTIGGTGPLAKTGPMVEHASTVIQNPSRVESKRAIIDVKA